MAFYLAFLLFLNEKRTKTNTTKRLALTGKKNNDDEKKDNMLKILENRGIDSSNSSPEHDLTSPTTSHPSETREAARLELTTIIEMIRRHHINQGSIHPSFSNLDKEDEAHLDGLVKTIDPDTYQYLIRHFHPIDNIKLVKNPNPNQVDQPIKMACRFSGFSYYCSSWRT
jgi:hypothetical protein